MMAGRALIALGIAAIASAGLAAAPVRTEQVRFAPGVSMRSLKSSVKGYGAVNYVVQAKAGQTLTVSMKTSNASSYFNVIAPGADAALFNAAMSGMAYSGKLPVSGAYKVQVYLMRNAARRNETARYTLSVGLKG